MRTVIPLIAASLLVACSTPPRESSVSEAQLAGYKQGIDTGCRQEGVRRGDSQERDEELIRLVMETDADAALQELPGNRVKLERSKTNGRVTRTDVHGCWGLPEVYSLSRASTSGIRAQIGVTLHTSARRP